MTNNQSKLRVISRKIGALILVCTVTFGLCSVYAVQKHSKPSDQNTKCTDNPADSTSGETACTVTDTEVECDVDGTAGSNDIFDSAPCNAGGTPGSPAKEYHETEVLEDIYCASGNDDECCDEKTDQPCVYKHFYNCHNVDIQKNCPAGGTVTVKECKTNSNTDPEVPMNGRTFAKAAGCPPE